MQLRQSIYINSKMDFELKLEASYHFQVKS